MLKRVAPVAVLATGALLWSCKHGSVAKPPQQQPVLGQSETELSDAVPLPPPPPVAPEPPNAKTVNVNTDRFLELWTDIHALKNGYFSPEGIPYHSVETLLVEAPDHGHETTSEAYSYWIWLEAMYGKVTKDWSHLDRAWKNMEYYIIPQKRDQPSNASYSAGKPATYAEERDLPEHYPTPLVGSVPIGKDPIFAELSQAYGTPDIYAMHWLLDVDNFYGFGNRGDGSSRAAYINTFQRGVQESVWETVPQPSWDAFNFGNSQSGYLAIFQDAPNYAKQWKYTNAPDADARAVQAMFWAKKWADEQGGSAVVESLLPKAARMGDYVRYSFFDKYFKPIGCGSPECATRTEPRAAAHYLVSWYFAWGGAAPGSGGWAWRIGSSHNHSGYQNPMAAYALGFSESLKPKSANGQRDWKVSLGRQLHFYRWLQSYEGGIAGGATNSWKGRYLSPPADLPKFYGMAYDESPVFMDPPSNEWFGFQVWSMQRVAEYYYETGDRNAQVILDRWVPWAMKHIKLKADESYEIPAVLKWSGKPAGNWDEHTAKTAFDASDASYNKSLRVNVVASSDDVGTTAALVHTLSFYAARKKDPKIKEVCSQLLDRMWTKYRDELGVASHEVRKDFSRFNQKVFVPPNYTGKMPNGDAINQESTFLGLRSKYKQDPDWPKVQSYLDGGKAPEFTYHRFWAQAHIALAYATYGWLFP